MEVGDLCSGVDQAEGATDSTELPTTASATTS